MSPKFTPEICLEMYNLLIRLAASSTGALSDARCLELREQALILIARINGDANA